MRLNNFEKNTIKSEAVKYFGKNVHVYLFGSRVDDKKKGGDIDLFIETELPQNKAFARKIKFKTALDFSLGEQKIDIIISSKSQTQKSISNVAKTTGIKL